MCRAIVRDAYGRRIGSHPEVVPEQTGKSLRLGGLAARGGRWRPPRDGERGVRSERVAHVVAGDPAAEAGADIVGVAEVEAGEDARVDDVVDRVMQVLVVARGPGDAAVEGERDVVGAEEGLQR